MFCYNCGKEIDDKAVICVHCGCSMTKKASAADAPSTGFAVLGFLVPIVGLILYLIYEGKQPLRAKSAGKGALIGVILSVVLSIIFVIAYMVLIGAMIGGMSSNII